mgnify:CR=1 FL=1
MPPTTLVFECGVMRFDASANLFVHLTHSKDAPQPIVIDGGPPGEAPGTDRRARLVGQTSDSKVLGSWPRFTSALPRGIVVEVRSYKEVWLSPEGALTVTLDDPGEIPGWFEAGAVHRFEREGEMLRMWDKSSRPDIKAAGKSRAAPAKKKATPKKKAAAKKKAATAEAGAKTVVSNKKAAAPAKAKTTKAATKKAPAKGKSKAKTAASRKPAAKKTAAPKTTAPKVAAGLKPDKAPRTTTSNEAKGPSQPKTTQPLGTEPEVQPKPKAPQSPAPPSSSGDPYRPDRMPAGSYTAGRRPGRETRSLGCAGLMVLATVAITGLAALL